MGIDNSGCENEPIRFSGAVMPYGALVVRRTGPSLLIDAACESCRNLLGLSPETMLGVSFGKIFGAVANVRLEGLWIG